MPASTRRPAASRKPAPPASSSAPSEPPANPVASEPQSSVKPTRKPSRAKAAGTASTKPAVKAAHAASAAKAVKVAPKPEVRSGSAPKPARLKLVRDSFTMPKPDFELIDALKQRALKQGREVKKSELLRAGLHALAALADAALLAAVEAVPRLKTGRPHKKAR